MNTKTYLSIAAALCLLTLISFHTIQNTEAFDIDKGHTSVAIKVQRFGVVDVVGRFSDVSGTVHFDANDITKTSATVSIRTDSYNANNAGGEDAVKSAGFLDAVNYPEIIFRSEKAYSKEGKNYISGDLTIKGVTKQIEFPFDIIGPKPDLPTKKQSIGIAAKLSIDRLDFGVGIDKQFPDGTYIIGKNVEIQINLLGLTK